MALTYRELALKAVEKDDAHTLWHVGEWMGNEGSRAQQFPDACPENTEDVDIAEFQERLEWLFEQEAKEEEMEKEND